jgi:regulator of sigma E protease
MPQIFEVIISIAALFFIANSLILAHEFGHYETGRITGVTARSFALGFGPRLVQWTDRRGTVWSLSLLPMGGYVSFPGEESAAEKGGYLSRPPLARMAIIAAGPMANILVAIGIYACIYTIQGMPTFLPVASSVVPGSPAAVAGFQPGDGILAVDHITIGDFDDLRPILEDHPGQTLKFAVNRHGVVLDLSATLDSKPAGGREVGYLGIWSNVAARQKMGLGQALVTASQRTWQVLTQTLQGIGRAITTGQGVGNFRGVIGVAHLAGQAAAAGGDTLLTLMAVLSVNLALMNLLPIPVLDGGAFLFCFFEWIRGRPAPDRVQDFATRAGLVVIMCLFLYSTLHDLAGLGVFDWIPDIARAATTAHIVPNWCEESIAIPTRQF